MSHNLNQYADSSGFNYPSAAGIPTNINQTHIGIIPTGNSSIPESSSSVPMTTTINPTLDNRLEADISLHQGKFDGEHGGAGTRSDDRKGMNVKNDGYTATPVAKQEHE